MSLDSGDNGKVFTRRAVVIGGIQLSILAVLGGRLAWLQVAQGQRYKMLSDQNRINLKILAPSRGQIVDRFGAPLAVNNQNFRALIIPEQTTNLEQSLRDLQKYIAIDESSIQKILKQSKKMERYAPLQIKENLTWDEVAAVEVHLPDLPGLAIDTGEARSYPFSEATAHMVGYVGSVSDAEMTDDPLLSLPGFKVGKSGIEKEHDQAMRGKAGNAEVEVNVVGREIRELKRTPPETGKRIMLTIDAGLQNFAQQTLSAELSASGVVMDVHTGAVYALASHPSFDPNIFTRGIPEPVWMELSENPANPLSNKAISGQYPPGSTFKVATALAGLRTGKITRERTTFCPGHYDLGETRFHCWKPNGHGNVTLETALEQSCDVYFYDAAKDIGIDQIAVTARSLGLGSRLDFDLDEEKAGLVPDRAWKQGESWALGETLNTGIGQGAMLATPLQLAVMTSRIVNGGYAVKPWLTEYVGDDPTPVKRWPKMNLSDAHLALVRNGMNMVVNTPGGTGYGARIKEPEWAMGGKSGTAQVRRITQKQRDDKVKNETLPWIYRHHALFIGYAPLDNPKYACCVVVEHGVGGSKAAAPMVRDLLREVQRRNLGAAPAAQPETPAPTVTTKQPGKA